MTSPPFATVLLAFASLCGTSFAARADTVVKSCALDSAYGEGTTLRDALEAGGKIRFDCPRGTVMKVRAHYVLKKPVEIDGAGAVTFDGSGMPGTFLSSDNPVILRGLTFRNFETAVVVRAGTITECQFETMSKVSVDASLPRGRIEILHTTFAANRGTPLALTRQGGVPGVRVSVRANIFHDNEGGTDAGAIDLRSAIVAVGGAEPNAQPAPDPLAVHFDFAYNRFERNQGAKAGAIAADLGASELTSVGDLFLDNVSSSDGGGVTVASGTATFTHGLFKGGKAGGRGAAMFVATSGHATLANVLVVGANGPSAAIEGSGLVLANVTIAGNNATGLKAMGAGRVGNTLLAGNVPGDCATAPTGLFQGSNVAADRTCSGATMLNPGLDSFFVPTNERVLAGGDATLCRAPPIAGVDLAFQARSDPAHCAVGAFERAPTEPLSRGVKLPDVHATVADEFTEADGYQPLPAAPTHTPPPKDTGSASNGSGSVSVDPLLATLAGFGVDYSVPKADLRSWLKDPESTPYPAIAQALITLLQPRGLQQPVYIDVIVFNYEHTRGARSPRQVNDVDAGTLKQAILEGYNNRHLPHGRTFEDLLR